MKVQVKAGLLRRSGCRCTCLKVAGEDENVVQVGEHG
jgi:hypothetical protein